MLEPDTPTEKVDYALCHVVAATTIMLTARNELAHVSPDMAQRAHGFFLELSEFATALLGEHADGGSDEEH